MNRAMKTGLSCLAIGIGALSVQPSPAQAGIDACGDIHVEAEAECEIVPPGATCEGMCEPLTVRAACAAKLAAQCEGGCDELPSTSCTGSCMASCEADCSDFEPGEFDCEASCEADCNGSCEASCEADSDEAGCIAKCQGSCTASCSANCDVTPPKADCEASCEASCKGSCEVDTNLDCQIDCQAEAQADCELEVQGGCEVDCKTQEGALFCDGQYIDYGNNLEECTAALKAALDVEVTGSSNGSSMCSGGTCSAAGQAEGSLKSDCSTVGPGARGVAGTGWLALLGLACIGWVVRRRSL